MTNQFPCPIAYRPEEARGRDFMGQQALIQQMVDYCVPSFTNATYRLRYYSFWAWAFTKLQEYFVAIDEGKQQHYLFKLETALIMCNRLRQPEITRMAGIEKVSGWMSAISEQAEGMVQILYEEQRPSSFDIVQYRPSLSTLEIVRPNIGRQYNITEFGMELARIFDNRIKCLSGYKDLIDSKKKAITVTNLKSLNNAFSLDSVSIEEREVFQRVIENRARNGIGTNKLIETTVFLLDCIERMNVRKPGEILSKVWNREYIQPEELTNITGLWLVIQTRRYYQYSVEGILYSFLRYLDSTPNLNGTFEEYSDIILSSLLKMLNLDSEFADSHPFRDLLKHMEDRVRENYEVTDKLVTEVALHESRGRDIELAATCLLIQVALLGRYKELLESYGKKAKSFLSLGHGCRHSLSRVNECYAALLDLPTKRAIKEIITELVLKVHLGVAQEKWLQTGNYTFKFAQADDYGYTRTKGSKYNNITMTSCKIESYLSILKDLGFWIDINEGMQLEDAGKAFREKWISQCK